jgi:hypothetical protein
MILPQLEPLNGSTTLWFERRCCGLDQYMDMYIHGCSARSNDHTLSHSTQPMALRSPAKARVSISRTHVCSILILGSSKQKLMYPHTTGITIKGQNAENTFKAGVTFNDTIPPRCNSSYSCTGSHHSSTSSCSRLECCWICHRWAC